MNRAITEARLYADRAALVDLICNTRACQNSITPLEAIYFLAERRSPFLGRRGSARNLQAAPRPGSNALWRATSDPD